MCINIFFRAFILVLSYVHLCFVLELIKEIININIKYNKSKLNFTISLARVSSNRQTPYAITD